MSNSLSRRKFIKASGIALGSSALPATPLIAQAATAKALAANPPEATRILARWIVESRWQDVLEHDVVVRHVANIRHRKRISERLAAAHTVD